jgi:hypothetical protein
MDRVNVLLSSEDYPLVWCRKPQPTRVAEILVLFATTSNNANYWYSTVNYYVIIAGSEPLISILTS